MELRSCKNFASYERGSNTSPEVESLLSNVESLADDLWERNQLFSPYRDNNYSSTELNIPEILTQINPLQDIENEILCVISFDIDEDIDIDDKFDAKMYRIVNCYNSLAIMVISNLIESKKLNFLQSTKILCFLGRIRHLPTLYARTWILENKLFSNSKYIRDAACLGLLYLENPSTINSIEKAISREASRQLKKNMAQVLEELGTIFNGNNLQNDTE